MEPVLPEGAHVVNSGDNRLQDGVPLQNNFHVSLYDADGLPWTSRLSWGWILFLTFATGFLVAIPLGIYLGLWLKTKGRSVLVLSIYIALAVLGVALALPFGPTNSQSMIDAISLLAVILWFGGAYILRYQVVRYYSDREGTEFRINPFLTALLSVWYINGCLRAEFPLDKDGKLPEGILRLQI
jgi:hypothetical protein